MACVLRALGNTQVLGKPDIPDLISDQMKSVLGWGKERDQGKCMFSKNHRQYLKL